MQNHNITLGNYNNSLNFIFGLTGGEMSSGNIDILNNPYVNFVALERKNGRTFFPKYDIELCQQEFFA